MPSKKSVGIALRYARRAARVSQDGMTVVSSRSYVSSVERGAKSPTMEKLSEIATALGVDPATIVVVASLLETRNPEKRLAQICADAARILLYKDA